MAQNSPQPTWEAAALAAQLGKIAEQSQRLVQDFLLDRPDIARLGMGDVTTLGGAFIGHAIHAHDALYEIAGPARSVHARGKALVNPLEIEDTLVVSLEMADGSLAALTVTGAGSTWANNLAVDGSITVTTVTRPTLNFTQTGNSLQFSWNTSFGSYKLNAE